MKIKEFLILLIVSIIASPILNAQNPFAGTWEYESSNNQVFRVILYDDPDFASANHLIGDYKLIQRINGVETLIYKSNFEFDSPVGVRNVGYEIFGSWTDIYFSGLIRDNTTDYQQGWQARRSLSGTLLMTILPPDISCTPCLTRARWEVKEQNGLKSTTAPNDFNIPVDVIMTKVN